MKEFTVIQRLVWLASLVAGLSSYAYVLWANRRRIPVMVRQRFLPQGPEILLWTTFFLAAVHSGKESDMPGGGALRSPGGNGRASTKDRLSIAGDWLAPIIVCFLVITMSLAIVGFLLGER